MEPLFGLVGAVLGASAAGTANYLIERKRSATQLQLSALEARRVAYSRTLQAVDAAISELVRAVVLMVNPSKAILQEVDAALTSASLLCEPPAGRALSRVMAAVSRDEKAAAAGVFARAAGGLGSGKGTSLEEWRTLRTELYDALREEVGLEPVTDEDLS